MKSKFYSYPILIILIFLIISCKKNNTTNGGNNNSVLTVTTTAISYFGFTGATSGGNVISDGGSSVTARGVCWSTNTNPTIALSTKTIDGSGVGVFSSSITGLARGTTYYVRAYATNSGKTAYGNEESFTTSASLATLTTTQVTTVTATSATNATSGGNITNDGGGAITARGVVWSNTTPFPTISLSTKTNDGTGIGSFTSSITGLTPNTLYYVRAYATNSAGTSYGNEIPFTTTLVSPYFTIGQSYGGGKIFYINATLQHGLIAATSDQSSGVQWGCSSTYCFAVTVDGQDNTNRILNYCNQSGTAARICDQLVLNGYSDWFLPSKIELNRLYLQKNIIGGFTNNRYWCSNELEILSGEPVNTAYFQLFLNGYTDIDNKGMSYSVRAIRAF